MTENDNIFNFPEPDTLRCSLWTHYPSHQWLIFKVSDNGKIPDWKSTFIGFGSVQYIQCPLDWRGANFKLGALEERVELWSKLKPSLEQRKLDFLAEISKLYLTNTSLAEVKILTLGSLLDISHEMPKRLLHP